MKSKFLLFAVTLMLTAAVYGQQSKTPPAAVAAFEKAFPGASKVKWEKEKEDFEVNFVFNAKEMSAVYNKTGVLQETEETIAVSALPAPVTAYVNQHYKNASIKEAAKITKANGEVTYEAEVNKTDLIFNTTGKFIKSEKD